MNILNILMRFIIILLPIVGLGLKATLGSSVLNWFCIFCAWMLIEFYAKNYDKYFKD